MLSSTLCLGLVLLLAIWIARTDQYERPADMRVEQRTLHRLLLSRAVLPPSPNSTRRLPATPAALPTTTSDADRSGRGDVAGPLRLRAAGQLMRAGKGTTGRV